MDIPTKAYAVLFEREVEELSTHIATSKSALGAHNLPLHRQNRIAFIKHLEVVLARFKEMAANAPEIVEGP